MAIRYAGTPCELASSQSPKIVVSKLLCIKTPVWPRSPEQLPPPLNHPCESFLLSFYPYKQSPKFNTSRILNRK